MISYVIIAIIALIILQLVFKAAKLVIQLAVVLILIGIILYYFNIDIRSFF